jgi:hypothetical protein
VTEIPIVLKQALVARIARADLDFAPQFFIKPRRLSLWLPAIKLAAIAVANTVDAEKSSRSLYSRHPEVSEKFKAVEKGADFLRYLRNTYAGHQNESLIEQAVRWQPYLRHFVTDKDVPMSRVCDALILETAINTYVADDGNHKLFDSETDINYPPDRYRFDQLMLVTTTGICDYLDCLVAALLDGYAPPDQREMMALSLEAGQIDFGFVTKGKR